MKYIKGLTLLLLYTVVVKLLWGYYAEAPFSLPSFPEMTVALEAPGTTNNTESETTSEIIDESAREKWLESLKNRLYRQPSVKGYQATDFVFLTDDRWLGSAIEVTGTDHFGIWTQADENYFSDAVFIGDSRTEGFQIQSGIKQGTFFTAKGLNVESAFTKPIVNYEGSTLSIVEALQKDRYGKVYIMLGVNELGWPYEQTFVDTYAELIDAIQSAQPDATLYIQSIIHVSEAKSTRDAVYNNAKINRFNTLIQSLAREKKAIYLDLNTVLSDENGNLFADASSDGVHLNPQYCKVWYKYLKDHVWQSNL